MTTPKARSRVTRMFVNDALVSSPEAELRAASEHGNINQLFHDFRKRGRTQANINQRHLNLETLARFLNRHLPLSRSLF